MIYSLISIIATIIVIFTLILAFLYAFFFREKIIKWYIGYYESKRTSDE